MVTPVVISGNGFGAPVTQADNGSPVSIAGNGFGTPIVEASSGSPVTVVYDETAISALFARMTAQPTIARKVLISDLITALIDAGIWAKLDAFYVMAAHDAQAAQLNWIEDQFNLTPVLSPTFTADQGYAGNDSTSYLNTGFNPVAAGGLYQLNSAHLSIWSRTNIADISGVSIGARVSASASQALILLRNTSDLGGSRLNQDAVPVNAAVTDSRGFFVGSRLSSANQQFYRNGSQLASFANVSTAMPNFQMYICGANTNGTFGTASGRQYSVASIGSGLNSTEVAAFNIAVTSYMQAIGAA